MHLIMKRIIRAWYLQMQDLGFQQFDNGILNKGWTIGAAGHAKLPTNILYLLLSPVDANQATWKMFKSAIPWIGFRAIRRDR
jgi:hypothetical protein